MAEFESLATHEPLTEHARRHALDRLMMLCDGVFAIAITLAALEIHAPDKAIAAANMPREMVRPVIAYALSFAIIAVFWLRNRDLFARVQRVDKPMTMLVLGQLCVISLIPVGVRGVAEFDSQAGFRFYALTMTGCGLLNLSLWTYASLAPGIMLDEVGRRYRARRVSGAMILLLMFAPLTVITSQGSLRYSLIEAVVLIAARRVLLKRFAQPVISPD